MINAQQVQEAKKELGRRLAGWRKERGLWQQDLANAIPISRSSVAGVENGNQVVDETFWTRCDTLLRAGGELSEAYRGYRELELRYHTERTEAARRERWGSNVHITAVEPTSGSLPDTVPPSPESVVQEVLDAAALAAAGEAEGLDLGLVEQRVLQAHHARRRQSGQGPMLVVVGGYAGSGKTELGRLLATMTGWPLLDKDTLTRPMTEELLRTLDADPNDRHSDVYLQAVRPVEYRCLLSAAFDQLRHGTSTIIAAPLLREAPDPGWLRRIRSRFAATELSIATVWVDADIEAMYRNLARRDAARDTWKLTHWDTYSEQLDLGLRPAWSHLVIDNGIQAIRPLEQQVELIGRIVSPS
jgi:predicted kinase/transcriptional regulator with XRE-family HTH domain